MKVYGKHNIFSGAITSNISEESDKAQNILPVDKLSEFDTSALDQEITILDKDEHLVKIYDSASGSWKNKLDVVNDFSGTELVYDYHIEPHHEVIINAGNDDSNHISVDKSLFDFGPVGSQVDFVIDFILPWAGTQGTLLYNGKNTGQVDLELNKNLLITTHGSELIKDPNYQNDPTVVQHSEYNGYLNIVRPRLKSKFQLNMHNRYHVALIKSGDTTYLAINGHIHDSAPSVDYFAYDDVLLGSGYSVSNECRITAFRVTKGTDLGWTKRFTPPMKGDDNYCDFVLDTTSMVDIKGNYDVNVIGSPHTTDLNSCYPIFVDGDYRKVRVNLSRDNGFAYVVMCDNPHIEDFDFTIASGITDFYIQNSRDEQINYNVLDRNSKILKVIGRDTTYDKVIRIKRGKSNTWFQSNPNLVHHPLFLPHIPQVSDGTSIDATAVESSFFSTPQYIDTVQVGDTAEYSRDAFVDQTLFGDLDISAFSLKNHAFSIMNQDTFTWDIRVDILLKYNAHPVSNRSFYRQRKYYAINNQYTNNGTHDACQMLTNGQIRMYMPYNYQSYKYSNSISYGSASGYTAALTPGYHYLVSLMWDGVNVTYGTCYLRSFIKNLDTGVIVQNNSTIGSAYQNPYSSFRFYCYAPHIDYFYSGNDVDIIAYRKRRTSGGPARTDFDNISDFWGFN